MPGLENIASAAGFLWESLWHATALAVATGLLSVSLLRNGSPGWKALLWTAVLVKFLLPPRLLPGAFSFSQWLAGWLQSGLKTDVSPAATLSPAGSDVFDRVTTTGSGYSAWLLVLATAYLVGVVLFAVRWGNHSLRVSRLLKRLPEAPPWLAQEVYTLARVTGLRVSRLRIRVSPGAGSPYLVGLARRTLVLPEALLQRLEPQARQALILHEMAHLRRADLVVRWLQNLVRTLFFFWPPVWWVCRRIERLSEMACDQWAVAKSRVSERQYAESVLEVARSMARPSNRQFNLALIGRGRFLEERFEMILNSKASATLKWYWIPLLVLWIPFALAGTVELSTPQEHAVKKRVQIHKHDGDPDSELPAQVLEAIPEADLNGDGVLTVGELEQHLDAQDGPHRIVVRTVKKTRADGTEEPAEVTVEVSPHIEGTEWHHSEEGELHEHEFEKEMNVFVESGEGEQHHVIVHVKGEGDLSAILERHPDADLDGDGVEDLLIWRAQEGNDFIVETGDHAVRRVQIEDIDLDRDGNITKQEIEAYRQICCPEGHSPSLLIAIEPETRVIRVGDDEVESGDRLGRLLQKYPDADLDGDGTLSKEEALALASRLQKKKPQ